MHHDRRAATRVRTDRPFHLRSLTRHPSFLLFFYIAAQEIVERISKGEWTASEVLDAYISRAIQAQDVTNCLTEGAYYARPRPHYSRCTRLIRNRTSSALRGSADPGQGA